MHRFKSLLLPLDGSPEAAKGVGCALWLARELGASLHVLHAGAQALPVQAALERLRVDAAARSDIVLHQMAGNAADAVVAAISVQAIDLVVMSACGQSKSSFREPHSCLGSVAQAVIERCPVPVLLLPVHYREALPWTTMLAAASGEAAADQALEAAVQLAAAVHVTVTVVHSEERPLAAYADMVHHEYPQRVEQMVERGLAGCADEECRYVGQVLIQRGDPASVLLRQIARHHSSVLALGWHGALEAGRALVLKRLLEEAHCPLLLVRSAAGSKARLMIGVEIDD